MPLATPTSEYVPTPAEAEANKRAFYNGDFEAGLWWTVVPSEGESGLDSVSEILKLGAQKVITIERRALIGHAEYTWFLIKLTAGLGGEVGAKLSALATWKKTSDPAAAPQTTTPKHLEEDPTFEWLDENMKAVNKWVDKFQFGASVFVGLAAAGLLVYAISRFKK